MAITVQTNDGLSTANSYVSVADFDSYLLERGISVTTDSEQLLLRAMDVLDAKQYKSEYVKREQSTEWPRMGAGIPRAIKQAQILLAIMSDSVDVFSASNEAATKREKVDAIEVEYFENQNAVTGSPLMQTVNELLAPYLASSGSWVANIRTYRG